MGIFKVVGKYRNYYKRHSDENFMKLDNTLLYFANRRYVKFMEGISKAHCERYYSLAFGRVDSPFAIDLSECCGVVFVGPQTSSNPDSRDVVFGEKINYFKFVDFVHQKHGLPIAAVLDVNYSLPHENYGVDQLIITGDGRTMGSIVRELVSFFNEIRS